MKTKRKKKRPNELRHSSSVNPWTKGTNHGFRFRFTWPITLSPHLHWKLDAGMPASTAQCCRFFQNQPVVECSCTVDTLQGQTSDSKLPWLPLHSLVPFLPLSRLSLRLGFTPVVYWSAFRCTAVPSTTLYMCMCVCKCICVIRCVCALGYSEFHKRR